MITFPCAKINLGLNIVSKRADGYHNLETVFYPIPLTDALDIKLMGEEFPSEVACDLKITGNAVDCDEQKNLVVKAYNMLAADFKIPRIHTHLVKRIPSQAGMGGGSADAAYTLKMLSEMFGLGLDNAKLAEYASRLGSDCAFFIWDRPMRGEGRGEILTPFDLNIAITDPGENPENDGKPSYELQILTPEGVSVSTAEAYRGIVPTVPERSLAEVLSLPVSEWKELLVNDFEQTVFKAHPELAAIKKSLYDSGADYAAMSGSGSALFALYKR